MVKRKAFRTASGRAVVNLDILLRPSSIAIIGASSDPTRIGGRPIQSLIESGYQGAIYPINPTRNEIQGIKAYPNIRDVPGPVDTVIIGLPQDKVIGEIEHCAAKGVRAVVVFTAGFAEHGETGKAKQNRLTEIAAQSGMRIVGPNCLGAFNADAGVWLTFTAAKQPREHKGFRFALASQSGGFGSHILKLANLRGISIRQFLTTGNECDVECGEAIRYFAQDPSVDGIIAYVEGLRTSEAFLEGLAIARANKKPIVLAKVGRTERGAAAARSHTASLAGSDAIYDVIFREFGVHRAVTIEELLDVSYAIEKRKVPANNKVAILTSSGGAGIQSADFAVENGLELPAPSASVRQDMLALVPYASTGNPIDVTAQLTNEPDLLGKFNSIVLRSGEYGAVYNFIGMMAGSASTAQKLLDSMSKAAIEFPKVPQFISVTCPPEITAAYEKAGFLVYEDPARAMKALGALVKFANVFAAPVPPAPKIAQIAAPKVAAGLKFNEATAKKMLARYGVLSPPERLVATPEQAGQAAQQIGFPVAIKVASADILHKTEIGGVALNIDSEGSASAAVGQMQREIPVLVPDAVIDGYLVTSMIRGGVECILGSRNDPVFGPIIMFGLGGVFVELMKDVTFRRVPVSEEEANKMIREVRGFSLLAGYRGKPAADVDALVRAICGLSHFANHNRDVLESVEINPLVVLPKGQGAFALDAVVETMTPTK